PGFAGLAERESLVAESLLQPLPPVVGSANQTYPLSPVVVHHDFVALEHHLVQKSLQWNELASRRPGGGDNIEEISVNQKLSHRSRFDEIAHLLGPRRKSGSHWLSFIARPPVIGGGSVSKSSMAP